VMENYLFYEPLQKLKETVESGELGAISGYHMKMVGSGRGGWEVPRSSYEWQFAQMRRGRGILVFDDGWHKLSTALWLFGPLREVRAWVGGTEVLPNIELDAPTTIVWEHQNGIRGVWDITLAPDMYLRSDYYTNDERWEVTGSRGYSRVNRCTGRGIQQPSLETYVEGKMQTFHALDDDWASSFRNSGRHWLRWLRTGEGPLLWSAQEAVEVLRFALAVYASSAAGGGDMAPDNSGGAAASSAAAASPPPAPAFGDSDCGKCVDKTCAKPLAACGKNSDCQSVVDAIHSCGSDKGASSCIGSGSTPTGAKPKKLLGAYAKCASKAATSKACKASCQ